MSEFLDACFTGGKSPEWLCAELALKGVKLVTISHNGAAALPSVEQHLLDAVWKMFKHKIEDDSVILLFPAKAQVQFLTRAKPVSEFLSK